ncbi:MAG: 1-acyl-sn-glycerol-3-phosphate acyltransferase [Candidatus Marinimicrobia bacterium]|nr:1-acyl-sn-glycerol-3-phosphate acyltransferase [Candidatus Neomarinimicrobiota bacterium]
MIRVILILFVMTILLIIPGLIVIIVDIFDRKGWFHSVMMRMWARAILKTGGIRVEIKGLEKIDRTKSYVIVSNHESALDILVIAAYIPLNFRFLAKKELFRIPLLGWILMSGRHISIDRENPRKSVDEINKKVGKMFKKGVSTIVFPEGTRSVTGELLPFKKGAFVLSYKFGVPILPIALIGTGKITPKRKIDIKPGKVVIRVLEPRCVKSEEEIESVKEEIRREIEQNKKLII